MNRQDLRKFNRLIQRLNIPADRRSPNQANLRWLIANGWIEHQQNPDYHDLVRLIRPYA